MTDQKDYRIELLRFISALIIMIFHAHNINNGQGHPIPLGYVFVEFFFFLTGYFTYSSLVKRHKKNASMDSYPMQYTFRKIRRIVPYIIMTASLYVVISLLCNHFIRHLAINDSLHEFSGLPFDILLLQVTGICKNPNFNVWWYLSAIMFVLPITIVLFYKKICSDGGVEPCIVYFVPLLIYGAFSVEVNGLDWEREVFGVVRSGIFRGFAGLCMGCTIYDLKDRLYKSETTALHRVILTIIEIASYIFSVVIALKGRWIYNSTFLIVLLLIVGLTVTFSHKSYTVKMNYRFFSYLGTVSLPLYMCHYSIGRLIGKYFVEDNLIVRYAVYFVCSFAFAICMLAVDRKVLKRNAG